MKTADVAPATPVPDAAPDTEADAPAEATPKAAPKPEEKPKPGAAIRELTLAEKLRDQSRVYGGTPAAETPQPPADGTAEPTA